MTVYDMVVSDLGLPVVNQFADQINRIINSTRAVMLRFLRRRDWPEEVDGAIGFSASIRVTGQPVYDEDGAGA